MQRELAHFYLLTPTAHNSTNDLKLREWLQDFLLQVLHKKEQRNTNIESHPDILFLPKGENKNYIIDDFEEFFSFTQYRPLEMNHRFIIIEDAHRIPLTLSNKLLKTFEELDPNTTIILCNPNKGQLLPTIESRAIKLRVDLKNSEHISIEKFMDKKTIQNELVKECAEKLSPNVADSLHMYMNREIQISDLVTEIKSLKNETDKLIEIVLKYVINMNMEENNLSKLIEDLKWYRESKVFNNAFYERVTPILANLR